MLFFGGPQNRAERRARARATRARRAPRPDRLAPRSKRLAAGAIDWVVATLVFWLVLALGALARTSPFEQRAMYVHLVAAAVVVNVYVIVVTALRGQTLGKRLTGIRVVRSDTFDLPSWRRATIRTVGLVPLRFMPYGGVAGPAAEASFLASRTRQGLHDAIAGTIVVDDRSWLPWYGDGPGPGRHDRAHRR